MNASAHPVELGPETEEAQTTERCDLLVWRGYRSAAFYVLADDGTAIATSVEFRSRGREPQETEAARQALTDLCLELEEAGWKRVPGEGETWYAAQFVRATETPIFRPPPERQEARPVVAVAPAAAPVEDVVPETIVPPTVEPEPAVADPVVQEPVVVQRIAAVERPAERWPLWKQLAVWAGAFAIATAAAGAVTFGAISLRGGAKTTTTFVTVAQPPATTPASLEHAKTAALVPAPAAHRRVVRLVITAPDRPSWLEVRRHSPQGPVLYSGILQPGQRLHFAGARVWARFAAAANLRISADGRVVALTGTLEKLFTAKR